MKRILLVTNELSEQSGWGRLSLDFSLSLAEAEVEVVVLCHKINPAFSQIKQIGGLADPLSYRRNYFLFWWPAVKTWFFLKKYQPELVHGLVETYTPTAWLLSKLYRCPLALTIHGSFGIKPLAYFFFGLTQKWIYRQADKIICISQYTKRRLEEAVGLLSQIVVIPNGINLSKWTVAESRNYIKTPPVLLGVGALKNRKGFHLVIEALPQLVKKFPGLEYWIVGDQSDKGYVRRLNQLITKFNLVKNIKFFERIADEKLNELYQQASVFVLTPLSDYYNFEGFGLVYLEANIAGLPVVGSYDNGGEEAILDGRTGFLSKANDPADIARCVEEALKDPILYARMSRESIAWAKNHDWQVIIKDYLDVYQKLL